MKKRSLLILTIGLLFLLTAGAALALSTPTVEWWVFGSGGRTSSVGNITLNDTIGQPVIGPSSSGGDVSLESGYWVSGMVTEQESLIYLPLVFR
jgi:hypothetical protein